MMKRILKSTVTIAFLLLCATCPGLRASEINPVEGLVKRIAPSYAELIRFETLHDNSDKDIFELESEGKKLIIRANNFNSMAVGFNYFLKYHCLVSVSYYKDDKINVPTQLPVLRNKVRREARVKDRFFLNYCTFGYSMPWWRWTDWEHFIDWMALNGINMPLAITGQEAIWYRVWTKLGLKDEQIKAYFTGPAYLPWHRMSNIDHWGGPLPKSWLDDQLLLQKKIVAREREFNMKPVLPAFAGHVPQAIKTVYPTAHITDLGSWGGFGSKYYSHFLDPFDPLFEKVQKLFLEEQSREFGTDHIYGADPFNEVTPPSWEPEYLANASRVIYNSISKNDPQAHWLQMTWVFYFMRKQWTNERIKAFVRAVPQDKMILLDYYCDNTEVWKLTDKFFNQPYIWCYLGNFGGNTMLIGNLKQVEERMENAFANGGKNMSGIGSTLEGFDANPVMYEYVFEKVWTEGPINLTRWIEDYARRRIGRDDANSKQAWNLLLDSVYRAPAALGQGPLTNAKPTLKGHGNWTTNPRIQYNNKNLLKIWELLLNARGQGTQSYEYDLVNITRQTLSNHFHNMRDSYTRCYEKADKQGMDVWKAQMLGLLDDLDLILSTQSLNLLGKWIEDARAIGVNKAEKNYYEQDARRLITTWGGEARSLNDYANRSWAGLTADFYKRRWQLFFKSTEEALDQGKPLNQKALTTIINEFEDNWVVQHKSFRATPVKGAFNISTKLYKKYASQIESLP